MIRSDSGSGEDDSREITSSQKRKRAARVAASTSADSSDSGGARQAQPRRRRLRRAQVSSASSDDEVAPAGPSPSSAVLVAASRQGPPRRSGRPRATPQKRRGLTSAIQTWKADRAAGRRPQFEESSLSDDVGAAGSGGAECLGGDLSDDPRDVDDHDEWFVDDEDCDDSDENACVGRGADQIDQIIACRCGAVDDPYRCCPACVSNMPVISALWAEYVCVRRGLFRYNGRFVTCSETLCGVRGHAVCYGFFDRSQKVGKRFVCQRCSDARADAAGRPRPDRRLGSKSDGAAALVRFAAGEEIHRAAAAAEPAALRELLPRALSGDLAWFAQPRLPGYAGGTALHAAARVGDSECIRLLLANNADPASCDIANVSCLGAAVLSGSVECTRLIAAVTPPTDGECYGSAAETPLLHAAIKIARVPGSDTAAAMVSNAPPPTVRTAGRNVSSASSPADRCPVHLRITDAVSRLSHALDLGSVRVYSHVSSVAEESSPLAFRRDFC